MSAANSSPVVNLLLDSLPHKELKQILQHCERVMLQFGNVICENDQPYRHLYFPTSGLISLVTTLGQRRPLELGLIGNEGMLGATVALGIDIAPSRAVVLGSGCALRISVMQLRQSLHECPTLQRTLQRYLYVMLTQLSQNAACGYFHELEPRLAKWLLMTHDRAHADYFYLTHQYLADMLGVRRSGVTIAAGALQLRHLIHYSRGQITILDRTGLEAAACECYAALSEDYKRLLLAPLSPTT